MTIDERARECASKLEPHGVHSWVEFATPIIAAALRAHTAELQASLAAAELRAAGELQRALKFEQLRDEAIRKLLAAEADNSSILARVKGLEAQVAAMRHDLETSQGLYACDNAEGQSLFVLDHPSIHHCNKESKSSTTTD